MEESSKCKSFLYHGTNLRRGQKFIKSQKMEPSIGNHHWIGDGSYFYEELFYSYKWIRDMYKAKNGINHRSYKELTSEYMVLECCLIFDKCRIFDLNTVEHKIEFDYFKDTLLEKIEDKSIDKEKIYDGVVINIMFNEMDYKENYDAVIATFDRRRKENKKSRLNAVLEKQICVKNLDIIKKIYSKKFETEYSVLEELVQKMMEREAKVYSTKRRIVNLQDFR